MSKPLVVSIPHRLGKAEALRRLKDGLGAARTNYSHLLPVEDEVWNGDRLVFRVRALGQSASGIIDVTEGHLQLEVTLPWLLSKITEALTPAIRQEGVKMLERGDRVGPSPLLEEFYFC